VSRPREKTSLLQATQHDLPPTTVDIFWAPETQWAYMLKADIRFLNKIQQHWLQKHGSLQKRELQKG
jgi:hypothetical protein